MKKLFAIFPTILLLALTAFPQNNVAVKTAPNSKDTTAAKSNVPVTTERIQQDVIEALSIIQQNAVGGKNIDSTNLFKSSIEGMLHTLDPHSNYFDAKETEQFMNDQSSRYFGIGATIGSLRDSGGKTSATYIRATFDGAPANRAGLRYGDKILEVNGVSMLGKPVAEVSKNLRGPRGTVAKVTVEHYGTGKRETVEITRDAVPQPSIPEAYMIRPGVGYIAMTVGFHQTTYQEFLQAMADLKSQGMQSLILDLRDNGGGLVSQAYGVANTFLSAGQTVLTQRGRVEGSSVEYEAQNRNPDKTPIVMLVNRSTASASEILAGALQDHDRALILGETTFGKGLVQNPFRIEDGSMLLLTIAKYYTPSGRLIQRDYSNGDLYDYYSKGGSLGDESKPPVSSKNASKTDTGRTVYGGVGIVPDETLKPPTISTARYNEQVKLIDPVFAYSLDLAYGKIPGFEMYKVDRPIVYKYKLKPTEFQVSADLYNAFKKYAVSKYKLTPAQIDREKEFVEQSLRTELVTAAYGVVTPLQVLLEKDDQIKKAIEEIPRAKQLALDGEKVNAQKIRAGISRSN